ncbi:type II toxin-antitoxin system HicB family antitoxin [Candidatus Micrarchaeota archaeon]|nr:type II toxin-antitoxin system HicB family antitoxin [Candidatus Micrarchaeota archaeon]
MQLALSAVVIPEAGLYAAWCPELDIASQGDSIEEALANLKEALELHFECLSRAELDELRKRQGTRLVTTLEFAVPA